MTNKQSAENSSSPFFAQSSSLPTTMVVIFESAFSLCKNQSFEDWEAIIVIDASPDDAFHIASQLSEEDDRIIIINKRPKVREPISREKRGVECARGKLRPFPGCG